MQKYKKAAINIAFLTMILSVGINSAYLSGFDSDVEADLDLNSGKIPKYSQDKQEKIINAFENNDYQAWKKIIGRNKRVNNLVDESIFQNFALARKIARNGQYDQAIEMTEKLKQNVKNKLKTTALLT
jgi:hypothetical protein